MALDVLSIVVSLPVGLLTSVLIFPTFIDPCIHVVVTDDTLPNSTDNELFICFGSNESETF